MKDTCHNVEMPYLHAGEIFGSLSDFDFEISNLSLSTLIVLPLDIISKYMDILSKPTEPKVSSALKNCHNSQTLPKPKLG